MGPTQPCPQCSRYLQVAKDATKRSSALEDVMLDLAENLADEEVRALRLERVLALERGEQEFAPVGWYWDSKYRCWQHPERVGVHRHEGIGDEPDGWELHWHQGRMEDAHYPTALAAMEAAEKAMERS
jgi:hypothetical protein